MEPPVSSAAAVSVEPSNTEPFGVKVNERQPNTLTGKPSTMAGCQRHWRRASIADHPSNLSPREIRAGLGTFATRIVRGGGWSQSAFCRLLVSGLTVSIDAGDPQHERGTCGRFRWRGGVRRWLR